MDSEKKTGHVRTKNRLNGIPIVPWLHGGNDLLDRVWDPDNTTDTVNFILENYPANPLLRDGFSIADLLSLDNGYLPSIPTGADDPLRPLYNENRIILAGDFRTLYSADERSKDQTRNLLVSAGTIGAVALAIGAYAAKDNPEDRPQSRTRRLFLFGFGAALSAAFTGVTYKVGQEWLTTAKLGGPDGNTRVDYTDPDEYDIYDRNLITTFKQRDLKERGILRNFGSAAQPIAMFGASHIAGNIMQEKTPDEIKTRMHQVIAREATHLVRNCDLSNHNEYKEALNHLTKLYISMGCTAAYVLAPSQSEETLSPLHYYWSGAEKSHNLIPNIHLMSLRDDRTIYSDKEIIQITKERVKTILQLAQQPTTPQAPNHDS